MRMSQLFNQTLRDAPAEAEITSHQLLLRAGFIRQLSAGIFSYLPLGWRTLRKIESIIRDEMNAIGGQEISMPVVHPGELWKETERWYEADEALTRFEDRGGRAMVLGLSHEEVIADLIRKEIRSYRQLPVLLYQIQTKWRDEARPRAGLIRVREFIMKDSYSLDRDEAGLDVQYRRHYQSYFNIYHRCGLPVIAVGADTGIMGGNVAHEFMYLTPIGEDTLLTCAACDYAANREIARFQKQLPPAEDLLQIEKVATPAATTIDALAKLLDIPASRTAKAVFMVATFVENGEQIERSVFAVVRGDMDLNEVKLLNALKVNTLRPATETEIRAMGAVPGYGSPVNAHDCIIVVDDAIPDSPNLVAGANEEGYHLLNVNLERDYSADIVADIVSARAGDVCPACGGVLSAVRGVEVGNIFKQGTHFTEKLNATYIDQEDNPHLVVMGAYGIGLGRLLACVAEHCHDDNGIIWPVSIAPYHVHLVQLPGAEEVAAKLYAELQNAGIEVLLDDRDSRAGVKFNDADLIGLPIRLTVGERSLESGGVEFKRRDQNSREIVSLDNVLIRIQAELFGLQMSLDERVVPVEYKA